MNKILNLGLIVLVTIFLALSGSGCLSKEQGDSADVVYGMEYSGLIWKTWKVYLAQDQLIKPGTGSDFAGVYTVDPANTKIIEELKEAKASGEKVKVVYEEHAFGEPWKYASKTVIIDVIFPDEK